jgi:hypothetical protein
MNNPSQLQITVKDHEHPSLEMVALEDRQFPLILHDILDYSECTGNAHIVSWHTQGCAFKIYNIQKFIQILPLFFRHNNYKSFQRQLNHYEFSRMWEGPEKGKAAVERFVSVAAQQVALSRRNITLDPLIYTFLLPRTVVIGCYKHKHFVRGDRKLAIAIIPQRRNNHAPKKQGPSKRHIAGSGSSLVTKVTKEMERNSMIKKEQITKQVALEVLNEDTVVSNKKGLVLEDHSPERPQKKRYKKSVQQQDWGGSLENGGDFVPMMQNALSAADGRASASSMTIMLNQQYTGAAAAAAAAGGEGGGPGAAAGSVPYESLPFSFDVYYTSDDGLLREQQYSTVIPPPAAAAVAPPGGLPALVRPSSSTTQKQQLFNNLKEERDVVVRQMWATIVGCGQQQQQVVLGDQGRSGGNSIRNSIHNKKQQPTEFGSSYPQQQQQQQLATAAPPPQVPPALRARQVLPIKERAVIEDRRRRISSGGPKPVPFELLPVLDFCVAAGRVQGERKVALGNSTVRAAAVRPLVPAQNKNESNNNNRFEEEEEDDDDECSSLVSLSVENLQNLEQTTNASLLQPISSTPCGEEEQFEHHHPDLLSCFEDMRARPAAAPARNKKRPPSFSSYRGV